MRINATKNISKITKSMKMVSASKLRGDQSRLEIGKPFAVSAQQQRQQRQQHLPCAVAELSILNT